MSVEIKGLKTIYNNKDETFITRGSRNWRHTKENFRVLAESGCHKDYVNQLSPSGTVCYVDESFDETKRPVIGKYFNYTSKYTIYFSPRSSFLGKQSKKF